MGSGIYLSADHRDIQYAVKELARHMAAPRRCDMNQAMMLGRYLQQRPSLVRVTTLDPEAHDGPLQLDVFCDSDWGGCVETRRSTDCHVVVLGGGVVTTSTQTQPGLPATSSPDAELRGISRACREAIFVHDLAVLDFGLTLEVPRIWSDSSTGITAAKRIGPGTKLRHLDVSEFYVQGAVQAGKVLLRKVKGTENPANYLTKHPKTGNEVAQALPSLAMVDPNQVAGNTASERHSVKLVRANPPSQWKPVLPFKPSLAIVSATVAQQISGVKAQPREKDHPMGPSSNHAVGADNLVGSPVVCVPTGNGMLQPSAAEVEAAGNPAARARTLGVRRGTRGPNATGSGGKPFPHPGAGGTAA